jgi:hypothetical protein
VVVPEESGRHHATHPGAQVAQLRDGHLLRDRGVLRAHGVDHVQLALEQRLGCLRPDAALAGDIAMPSNMPTAQLRMPAPFFPQLPLSARTKHMARSIRSPWYDLPVVQPSRTRVRRFATIRARSRMVSGWTPQTGPFRRVLAVKQLAQR